MNSFMRFPPAVEPPTPPPAPEPSEIKALLGDKYPRFEPLQENSVHRLVNEQMVSDILSVVLTVRFVNAMCTRTFFQPDEYFQSLEPAWQLAFGQDSGAWITWEWHNQIRSSLHPALFALAYYAVDKPLQLMDTFPQFRSLILRYLPQVIQSLFAAVADLYTWKLAERIYGKGSNASWAALFLTLFSPWNWFCSTRTFSNCLETAMTIAALYFWPWELTVESVSETMTKEKATASTLLTGRVVLGLRISMFLAVLTSILRPTNLLIWLPILTTTSFRLLTSGQSLSVYAILFREAVICTSIPFALSFASDYFYYGMWTFPPYQWLNFNITLDLAVFYGANDWHYYLSQGLPLLLTFFLPFGIVGLWKASSGKGVPFILVTAILSMIASLSLIKHKEVRFIYPLLPILHILAAPVFADFFYITPTTSTPSTQKASSPPTTAEPQLHRRSLLTLLLLSNITLSGYGTLVHQSGILPTMTHVRTLYEDLALDIRGVPLSSPLSNNDLSEDEAPKITDYDFTQPFIGFLMPCHSTPWRSQLFYADLKAWALTCEPPLDIPPHSEERAAYQNENDRFYADPATFLKKEIGKPGREWPRFIAGFQGVENDLRSYLEKERKGVEMKETWRHFNSHWIDDERRAGDVVIWELVGGKFEKPGRETDDFLNYKPGLEGF